MCSGRPIFWDGTVWTAMGSISPAQLDRSVQPKLAYRDFLVRFDSFPVLRTDS